MLRKSVLGLALLPVLYPRVVLAQSQPIPINIGWLPDANGPFFVAKDHGLFEKAGLAPTYYKFNSGPVMFAALKSNSIDVTEFGVSAFVAGLGNGIPMAAIAVAYDDARANALVARSGTGIRSILDLKGKRVAATRNSLSFLGLVTALQKNNMSLSDIIYFDVPVTAMIPTFQHGDVDAVWTWEPWAQKIVAGGGKIVATLDDVGIGNDVWAARKDWLKAQPEAAIRFITALDLATELIRRDPNSTTTAVAEAFNIPPEMARDIMKLVGMPTIAEQLDPESKYSVMHFATGKKGLAAAVKRAAEIFEQQGVIKAFPPLSSVFDPQPIMDYAKRKRS